MPPPTGLAHPSGRGLEWAAGEDHVIKNYLNCLLDFIYHYDGTKKFKGFCQKNLWTSSIPVLINPQRGNLSSLNKCVSSALSSENLMLPDINLGVRLHVSFLRGMVFQTWARMSPGAPLCSFLSHPVLPIPTASASLHTGKPKNVLEKLQTCRKASLGLSFLKWDKRKLDHMTWKWSYCSNDL